MKKLLFIILVFLSICVNAQFDGNKRFYCDTVTSSNTNISVLKTTNIKSGTNIIMLNVLGIRLYGDATSWEDLQFPLTAAKLTGVSDPSFTKIVDNGAGSTGIYAYSFSASADQQVFVSTEMPHDWKEGSNYYFHLHWYPATTDTGRIVFSVETATSDINSIAGNSYVTRYVYSITVNSIKKHLMTELFTVNASALHISHGIGFTIKRLGSDPSDTYPGTIWITRAAIHYERDSFGSNTKLDKD